MAGVAITVDKQIEKLKGRGMVMDKGLPKAREVLLDIGYYRMGFYWHPFEIDKDHNLIPGTLFSDILKLYYLDTDLKHILSKALNRIEINFKTQLIYFASNKYDNNPTWFADKKIVGASFVDNLPKSYTEKFRTNNKPIKNHHSKYPNHIYAPAWKTLEFLTFGSNITLFLSLQNKSLKESIANTYGVNSLRVFESFLLTILFIRNICAHGDLLFDCNTPKEIATSPLISFKDNDRHFLGSSIKVIYFMLNKISINRHDIISNEIESLFNKYKSNELIKKVIEKNIGHTFN